MENDRQDERSEEGIVEPTGPIRPLTTSQPADTSAARSDEDEEDEEKKPVQAGDGAVVRDERPRNVNTPQETSHSQGVTKEDQDLIRNKRPSDVR